MQNTNKDSLFDQAKEWVLEAGARIRESIDEPLEINTKSNANDLVTDMDHATEKFFISKIQSHFPEHKVLGEEGFGDEIKELSGITWIIDPIDGTMNFVHQKRNFAISLAVYKDGDGLFGMIYNVMDDILYTAEKGKGAYKNGVQLPRLSPNVELENSILAINSFWSTKNRRVEEEGIQRLVQKVRGTRSYGSAALEFAYVAEGIVNGYVTMRLSPWDIAAGLILIEEVGGISSRVNGDPIQLLEQNSILTCNPAIHEQIVQEYIELK